MSCLNFGWPSFSCASCPDLQISLCSDPTHLEERTAEMVIKLMCSEGFRAGQSDTVVVKILCAFAVFLIS